MVNPDPETMMGERIEELEAENAALRAAWAGENPVRIEADRVIVKAGTFEAEMSGLLPTGQVRVDGRVLSKVRGFDIHAHVQELMTIDLTMQIMPNARLSGDRADEPVYLEPKPNA